MVQLIENFNEDKNWKNGLYPQCINCRKKFYFKKLDKIQIYDEPNKEKRNIYLKNKRERDVNFRLISNTRNRIYKSMKFLTKQSSSRVILGIHIQTYRRWIEWQITPEMNWSNIEIDHVKPICKFNVSKDGELRGAFCWESTQPLFKKDHQYKGTKFNFLDDQLQMIKSYQFLKLNEERHSEIFQWWDRLFST